METSSLLRASRTAACALAGFILALAFPAIDVAKTAPNTADVGVWKLNVEKTRFSGGSAPASSTLTIRVIPGTNRLIAISRDVDSDGQRTRSALLIMLNGKVYSPISEDQNATVRAVLPAAISSAPEPSETRWNDRDFVSTGRVTRSSDGQTLSFTLKGAPIGKGVDSVLVYDRQDVPH